MFLASGTSAHPLLGNIDEREHRDDDFDGAIDTWLSPIIPRDRGAVFLRAIGEHLSF